MAQRNIIVIGASAGGVEAYQRLIPMLPADLPAAVFVVLHTSPATPNMLADILGFRARIPVANAQDGAEIESGRVYVAVPDHHLQLEDGRMRLVRGPKENRHRPSVDTLFRSAAYAKGTSVIGVVLTGLLDDGAAGLAMIKAYGGATIVQDPADAMFPSMPRNAIETANPEHVVPLADIAALLERFTREEAPAKAPTPAKKGVAVMQRRTVPADHRPTPTEDKPGAPSVYTCPECSGTLWHVSDGEVERYECRVGHAYSLASLVEANGEAVEEALWVALRTLEESASLSRRMAERARMKHHHAVVTRWEEHARGKEENAQLLRDILARANEGLAVNE